MKKTALKNRFISKGRSVQVLFSRDNLGVTTICAAIVFVLPFVGASIVCFNTTGKVLLFIPQQSSDVEVGPFVICFQ